MAGEVVATVWGETEGAQEGPFYFGPGSSLIQEKSRTETLRSDLGITQLQPEVLPQFSHL